MEESHLKGASVVLTSDMDTWESEIRTEIATALVDHAAKSRHRRQEWVRSALGGAKKVHAFYRTPPNPVEHVHDVQEASLLANSATREEERAKLNTLGDVEQSASRQSWTVSERTHLKLLDVIVIRKDGNDIFCSHTAPSTDGFLWRHFALLSIEALHTAALLNVCMENRGNTATTVSFCACHVDSGATTRLRRPNVACQQMQSCGRPCFEARCPNRNVRARDEATVSVWMDFAHFYERIEHRILWLRGRCFKFPLPLLRVAISAYQVQRVLVLHGEAATTGYPSRGVVAGCVMATYLGKLCCLSVLGNVVRVTPVCLTGHLH